MTNTGGHDQYPAGPRRRAGPRRAAVAGMARIGGTATTGNWCSRHAEPAAAQRQTQDHVGQLSPDGRAHRLERQTTGNRCTRHAQHQAQDHVGQLSAGRRRIGGTANDWEPVHQAAAHPTQQHAQAAHRTARIGREAPTSFAALTHEEFAAEFEEFAEFWAQSYA